jgi:hypothetical protein
LVGARNIWLGIRVPELIVSPAVLTSGTVLTALGPLLVTGGKVDASAKVVGATAGALAGATGANETGAEARAVDNDASANLTGARVASTGDDATGAAAARTAGSAVAVAGVDIAGTTGPLPESSAALTAGLSAVLPELDATVGDASDLPLGWRSVLSIAATSTL